MFGASPLFEAFPVTEVDAIIRRTLRAAFVVGLLSVAAGIGFGHVLVGPGVCLGLLLAMLNNRLFQASAARLTTAEGTVQRKPFAATVLLRLGAVTLPAILLLWFVRPMGWGVIGGLAVYQFLLLMSSLRSIWGYQKSLGMPDA
ncbi:MAG TPA: hypothetical protein VE990_11970 [Acidimicrobiales bacterium]|nr:hypothetical protein [Acidimicrobiales bacterium]